MDDAFDAFIFLLIVMWFAFMLAIGLTESADTHKTDQQRQQSICQALGGNYVEGVCIKDNQIINIPEAK